MARVVEISVVDATGAGAEGQTVVAGEFELTTSSGGIARALLDDGETTILVNGVTAYQGAVEKLRSVEVFTAKGERVG